MLLWKVVLLYKVLLITYIILIFHQYKKYDIANKKSLGSFNEYSG